MTRLGEAINKTLLNHLLKMFTALGIYADKFERPFLQCTAEFYASEGVKYMQQSNVSEYLKHVEVLILPLACSLMLQSFAFDVSVWASKYKHYDMLHI